MSAIIRDAIIQGAKINIYEDPEIRFYNCRLIHCDVTVKGDLDKYFERCYFEACEGQIVKEQDND